MQHGALRFTPPYHPRGNYTERVNRFIGESLRAMVNSPSGCKQDWHKLVKFVQFAYRRMFLPGTNPTPYMVARGRQPISPNEVDLINEDEAVVAGPPLDEHSKELEKNLKLATRLLTVAREEILKQRRISFNQNIIETVFEPGGIVKYYNHTVHRVCETGEMASKWNLNNRKYEVVSREGTIYAPRGQDTGATKRAHVSQLARMRLLSGNKQKSMAGAVESGPSEEVLWDKLRAGKFVLFYIKGVLARTFDVPK